jgi:hypothetical protein
VRACSLAYPACNSNAPYCEGICGPFGSMLPFRHYLINGVISEIKLLNMKQVFSFSQQLLPKIFLILIRI